MSRHRIVVDGPTEGSPDDLPQNATEQQVVLGNGDVVVFCVETYIEVPANKRSAKSVASFIRNAPASAFTIGVTVLEPEKDEP